MQYSINRPRPPSTWDYLQFPAWVFMYSWLGFTGLTVAVHFNQPLAYPVAVAGVWAAWLTTKQARRFDAGVEYVMNPRIVLNNPAPEPVKEIQVVERTETPNGQHLRYPDLKLTDREWPIFAAMMLRLEKITFRDLDKLGLASLGDLDGKLASGQSRYMAFVDKLQQMGWVDGAKLTDKGRDYLHTKLPQTTPLPAPVFVAASVTTRNNNKTTTGNGGEK